MTATPTTITTNYCWNECKWMILFVIIVIKTVHFDMLNEKYQNHWFQMVESKFRWMKYKTENKSKVILEADGYTT